jgi:hypothetical protein
MHGGIFFWSWYDFTKNISFRKDSTGNVPGLIGVGTSAENRSREIACVFIPSVLDPKLLNTDFRHWIALHVMVGGMN